MKDTIQSGLLLTPAVTNAPLSLKNLNNFRFVKKFSGPSQISEYRLYEKFSAGGKGCVQVGKPL
jgi:hypothetical protein